MPDFSFTAIDKEGKKITRIQEADTEDELIKSLQAQELVVVSIKLKPEKVSKQISYFTHRRIKSDDLVFFARQLATLIDAGVTLLKSLEVISKQIESKNLFFVVEKIKKDIEQGLTFRDSLAKHRKVFQDLWINLVETGEASGNLAIILDRLAKFLEQRAAFRREIISAMIYPVILFFVGIGAIFFFTLRIVPTFAELFKGFGIKLPLLTQMVINLSEIAQKSFIPAILTFFILLFIFCQYIKTEEGRKKFDKFKLRIPFFSKLFKNILLERFSSEMAILIESGVPLIYTLEITERAIGNKAVSEIVREVKESVRVGKTLSKPLADSDFFPPLLVQMVAIGEETGNLSQMFKQLASHYEEYLITLMKRLTSMFEPLMIIFMGGVIGTIVISMFLPIFSVARIALGN